MSGIASPLRTLVALLAATSFTLPAAALPIEADNITRKSLAPTLVELAYSTRQQAVFVSAPDWKEEARSSVLRLDPQSLKVQATIPLKVKGFGVALDDSNNRLYLTEGFNGAVGVVDTATNKSLGDIQLQHKVNLESAYRKAGISGEYLDFLLSELKRFKITDDYQYKVREAKFNPQSGRLFLPGLGYGVDSVLFVVNTRTQTLEKVIPGFGFYAVGIALDAKNNLLFITVKNDGAATKAGKPEAVVRIQQ